MLPNPDTFYSRWRLRTGAAIRLRDNADSPPENLLQAVWRHQRLRRAELRTLDEQPVRILHPGFWNREGGPDFRGAVVQFGNAAPVAGDVEVDIRSAGWRAHGHDRNPAFRNVVLHVVWSGEKISGAVPPTLPIGSRLDAPLGELSLWLDSEAAENFPPTQRGRCSPVVGALPAGKISELLRQAAQIRFRGKASLFAARARQAGWEQSFWEGIFRALGYKHNAWPMQCLAELRGRWNPEEASPLAFQARLLGIANLLPAELTRAQNGADAYLRRMWDCWWRERDEFADCVLPRSLWRFHGQRPANHPQRRLALAAHWLAAENLVARVEHWCAERIPDEHLPQSLLEILQVGRDDFWSWHWTIRSPRLKKPQTLLGAARVTDLAANVILPWLWSRAAEGNIPPLRREIEKRFERWPAAEDNSVLRLARQRVMADAARSPLRSAAEQQGLIQIARDFCDQSNAVCDNCRFPELARGFGGESFSDGIQNQRPPNRTLNFEA